MKGFLIYIIYVINASTIFNLKYYPSDEEVLNYNYVKVMVGEIDHNRHQEASSTWKSHTCQSKWRMPIDTTYKNMNLEVIMPLVHVKSVFTF